MKNENKPVAPNGQWNIQDTTAKTGDFMALECTDAVFDTLTGRVSIDSEDIDLLVHDNLGSGKTINSMLFFNHIVEIKLTSGEVTAYRN